MPNTLTLQIGVQGSGLLADANAIINPASETFQIGAQAVSFPGDTVLPALVLSTGTGNLQGNQWYSGQRVLAAGAFDLLNLRDAALGLLNGLGQRVQLARVVGFLIVVNNHDGVQNLRVGPQAQANAWQGPFSGVVADQYLTIYWLVFLANDTANGLGIVDATHNILPVFNPTAAAITYSIFVVGNE